MSNFIQFQVIKHKSYFACNCLDTSIAPCWIRLPPRLPFFLACLALCQSGLSVFVTWTGFISSHIDRPTCLLPPEGVHRLNARHCPSSSFKDSLHVCCFCVLLAPLSLTLAHEVFGNVCNMFVCDLLSCIFLNLYTSLSIRERLMHDGRFWSQARSNPATTMLSLQTFSAEAAPSAWLNLLRCLMAMVPLMQRFEKSMRDLFLGCNSFQIVSWLTLQHAFFKITHQVFYVL